jgi:hypothetical protein
VRQRNLFRSICVNVFNQTITKRVGGGAPGGGRIRNEGTIAARRRRTTTHTTTTTAAITSSDTLTAVAVIQIHELSSSSSWPLAPVGSSLGESGRSVSGCVLRV